MNKDNTSKVKLDKRRIKVALTEVQRTIANIELPQGASDAMRAVDEACRTQNLNHLEKSKLLFMITKQTGFDLEKEIKSKHEQDFAVSMEC